MKFKNVKTGVILETSNEMVIEQLTANQEYEKLEEVKEEVKETKKKIVKE